MSDPIHERGHALEELFCHQKNEELLKKLKSEMEAEEKRKALTECTGVADVDVLNRILAANIDASTLACFSLVPLVVVAWADGDVAETERAAILSASESQGLSRDSGSLQLLEQWLQTQPSEELLATWKDYVDALKKTLTDADYAHLKTEVLTRAKQVAEAAGGFLGLGNKVSKVEQAVLDDLAAAFV